MKIYVHVEEIGSGDDEDGNTAAPRVSTVCLTLSSALVTLDDVIRACCAAHARCKARSTEQVSSSSPVISPADVEVFTEREQDSSTRQRLDNDTRARKQITRYLRAAAAGDLEHTVHDSFDFELVLVQRKALPRARGEPTGAAKTSVPVEADAAANSTTTAIQRQRQQQQQQERSGSANSHTVTRAEQKPSAPPQPLQELLDLGARMMQQHKYRSAAQLFETLVLSADPSNVHALLAMGDIHATNQRFDVAVEHWYRRCWTLHVSHSDGTTHVLDGKSHALLMLDCGLKIARCEVQRGHFRESLEMIKTLQQLMRKGSTGRGTIFASALAAHGACTETQIILIKAQALYKLHSADPERQDAAITLLTHLLPDLQDPSVNLDALLMYSQIAFDRGKRSDALSMLLRVLVGRPDDKVVRQQLASFLSNCPDGIQMLRQAVPLDGASAAAAYAFIGTILKDFGALDASVACFELTLIGDPASATCALNHAHVLEVCNEYERAYNVLLSFFRRNPALSVAGLLRAETIASALDEIAWSSLNDDSREPQQMDVRWRVDCATELESNELDLLACFLAVVKILFLTGRVAGLPRLVSLIEPVRIERRALHRTTIRNEQAYYSCIAQLLSVPDRFVPSATFRGDSEVPPMSEVFVCGDSHTLATAWRELCVQGERVLLRPALVTGLKHWHLRRDAVFYPKANFWHVLHAIPRRARVVFLFGEIDCREGILLAVERGKYETVEEGMEVTVGIFLDALRDAVQQFGFEAFVHPVVPVLPETRSLVVAYNRIFERRVRASAICTWLDCFDDLLFVDSTSSEVKLRPEFALDGTHLHPRYLDVLERALDVALQASSTSRTSAC